MAVSSGAGAVRVGASLEVPGDDAGVASHKVFIQRDGREVENLENLKAEWEEGIICIYIHICIYLFCAHI